MLKTGNAKSQTSIDHVGTVRTSTPHATTHELIPPPHQYPVLRTGCPDASPRYVGTYMVMPGPRAGGGGGIMEKCMYTHQSVCAGKVDGKIEPGICYKACSFCLGNFCKYVHVRWWCRPDRRERKGGSDRVNKKGGIGQYFDSS